MSGKTKKYESSTSSSSAEPTVAATVAAAAAIAAISADIGDRNNNVHSNSRELSSTNNRSRIRVIKLPTKKISVEDNDRFFRPDVLSLSYCGTRGIGQIGSLKGITRYIPDFLSKVHTFIGCSAGAVNALFLSLGFSLFEILYYSINFSVAKGYQDIHLARIFDAGSMGVMSHDRIRKKTEKIILKKYSKVPTLAEAYAITGKRYIAVAVNDTQSKPEYYDYQSAPNLSCIEAMIMSMSAPFLFYQYMYKKERIVDGCLMDPYPLLYCDNGTNNIFGISVVIKNDRDPEESPLSFYNRCLGHTIETMRINSIGKMSSKCSSLNLTLTEIPMLENDNPNLRFNCYIEGYRQGEQYISRLLGISLEEFYGPFTPPADFSDVPVIASKKQGKKLQLAKMSSSLILSAAKGMVNGNGKTP